MSGQTLISLAPLMLTSAAIAVTLWLFFQLKTEISRRAPSSAPATGEQEKQEMEKTFQRFHVRLDRIEERNSVELSPPASAGFNVGRRTQILRLSRRGDTPDHIAATLRLPRREVELFLKVHDLSLHSAAGAKPEAMH